ncbi:MAG: Ig-like domain-containing protein [Thermoplasmata archaeon]|nr:Ig-like domain-containing protein [Thermoplasmata archaeon]MCJ7561388.1 Ig-like domain-containing protein [Thermoplasmata archaeon]
MAKRRTKEQQEKIRLLSEGYTECNSCGKMLNPSARRCPKCGSLTKSTKRGITVAAIVVILFVAAVAAYTFYPRAERYLPPPTVLTVSPAGYSASTSTNIIVSFNKAMNVDSVESSFAISPSVQGTFTWSINSLIFTPTQTLPDDSYFTVTIGDGARDATGVPLDCGSYIWSFSTGDLPTVRRNIGTGAGDFWTVYPATHPSSGQTVAHPDWVISALEQGVALILDHSEGCYPCIQQTQICESVDASHPELQYFDLLSGTDEPSASQAFTAYDPNGATHYVPLTIVVTKAVDNLGNAVVAWHSWEGVVDLITLTSWIQDAQSYYDECT